MATAINLLEELDILKSLDDRIRAVPPTDGADKVHASRTASEPGMVAGPAADCEVTLSDIAVAAQIARDRAYAQTLAAAEQKERLDFEFATKLQEQGMNATDSCDADRYIRFVFIFKCACINSWTAPWGARLLMIFS
jgi:hypothetical protein